LSAPKGVLAVEEIDILDLEESNAQTENIDIQMVYKNLLKGSRNHMRSFVSTIQRQTGETYQPKFLSENEYQTIVGSEIERGGNGQGKGGGCQDVNSISNLPKRVFKVP
jgi:hypothetical protein